MEFNTHKDYMHLNTADGADDAQELSLQIPTAKSEELSCDSLNNDMLLSLFPGIGLLDIAFEEQGFCVVRGPDLLWGGNIKTFHPPRDKFTGIFGGPPCQAHSLLQNLIKAKGYKQAENLIPEFERCVEEGQPDWFLMENVPKAPNPLIEGYYIHSFILNNRWLGEVQNRVRKFCFGNKVRLIDLRHYIQPAALESIDYATAICASNGGSYSTGSSWRNSSKKVGLVAKPKVKGKEALKLQGLPEDFFDHSPLTAEGKQRMVGNGVPLPMGRAIAQAIVSAFREVK